MAVFKIIEFIFGILGELFYAMNKFEIFPNVGFGTLVIFLSTLAFLLNIVMDDAYSDYISKDNMWIKKEKYQPEHAKTRKIKGVSNPFYKRKH